MLIRITQLRCFLKNRSILINTDQIKMVVPVDRNYSEDCSRIFMRDGSVINTNCYFSVLAKGGQRCK